MTASIQQSILTITVQHLPDGTLRNVQLRGAGPLEFAPGVAAQVLRQVADQLDPQIQIAPHAPNGRIPPT